jgi:hypothetical protein
MAMTAPQLQYTSGVPDRMIMRVEDLGPQEAGYLALDAVFRARQLMPRVTGGTANRLAPISGKGWFGIWFPDSHTWFLEKGTRAFTMRSLAGKVIPMWIDDPVGEERRKNPKAKVRHTEDGRTQVLIFRRAARIGQRKLVKKVNKVTGAISTYTTPMSYPGAPGRINRRQPGSPWTPSGARGGAISAGNGGVRWRHPGLRSSQYLNTALAEAAFTAGLIVQPVYATDGATWEQLIKKAA